MPAARHLRRASRGTVVPAPHSRTRPRSAALDDVVVRVVVPTLHRHDGRARCGPRTNTADVENTGSTSDRRARYLNQPTEKEPATKAGSYHSTRRDFPRQ